VLLVETVPRSGLAKALSVRFRTWKKTFGHHPLLEFVDHGVGGGGEPRRAGRATDSSHPDMPLADFAGILHFADLRVRIARRIG
jgi:hypothetical protein